MALIASPALAEEEPKERLVVMQVQGPGLSDYDKRSYRTAIVEGLRNKYKVLSGDEVDKIVNEIFEKESRENIECDTEKCFQDIAIAFQAELIASCTVVRKSGGYILNLQINNVLENENILSKSQPCRGCDEFGVIDQLKVMSGGKVSAPVATATPKLRRAPTVKEAPQVIPPSPPSWKGKRVGEVANVNLEWGFIVVNLDRSGSVKTGDRIFAKNQGGDIIKFTAKKVTGIKVSATTDGNIRSVQTGMEVFIKED